MNANLYNTTDYERKRDWTLGQNKPNSNPNKPNFKRDDGFSPQVRLSAWGRLTAESLGLLITQQIALLCENLLGAFTLNAGMVKLLKERQYRNYFCLKCGMYRHRFFQMFLDGFKDA